MSTSTSQQQRHRRTLVVVLAALAVLLVLFAGVAIGAHRRGHDTTGEGTVTVAPATPSSRENSAGANGSGLLVEPAPASTDGGHIGPAGVRVGFDQSCKGAVEAATAYTEIGPIGVQYFKPAASPTKVAAAIFATNASPEDRKGAEVSLGLSASQATALTKDPWVVHPSWGAFRVRSCTPGSAAAIDVWYCLIRTNPTKVAAPAGAFGRECLTNSYELVWQSADWKIENNDNDNHANDPTTDRFLSPDRTPLTVAQRATVVGVVPGWQEYADAPR